MKTIFSIFFLSIGLLSPCKTYGDDAIPQTKLEIRTKIQSSNLPLSTFKPLKKIDLNTIPSSLQVDTPNKMPTEKFVSSIAIIGQITGIQMSDYAHLSFKEDGLKESSYFCLDKSCDEFLDPHQPTFPIHALMEVATVERFFPEAGQVETIQKIVRILSLSKKPIRHSCKKFDPLPKVIPGCEGEACGLLTYGRNVESLKLYSMPDTSKPELKTLEKCSEPQKVEHFLQLKSLGSVLVTATTSELKSLGVQAGDLVPMASSIGEGFVNICIGNKEIMAYASIGPSGSGQVEPIVEIIDYPKSEAWLKIKTQDKFYWTPYISNAFMEYYSYEPQNLCSIDHPLGPEIKKNKAAISQLINQELVNQCKQYKGCNRADPTSSCPLEIALHHALIPKIEKIGRLSQCAALNVSDNICSSGNDTSKELKIASLYFTCNFDSERTELKERPQMNFNFSCPLGPGGFECHSSQTK